MTSAGKHRWDLERAVHVTGVRLKLSDSSSCIDELQVFATNKCQSNQYEAGAARGCTACTVCKDFTQRQVTGCSHVADTKCVGVTIANDATFVWGQATDSKGLTNVAREGTPFGGRSAAEGCSVTAGGTGSSDSGTGRLCYRNINDGVYGETSAWAPFDECSEQCPAPGADYFVGVRFTKETKVSFIVISRDRLNKLTNAWNGATYSVQVSNLVTAGNTTPDKSWTTIGEIKLTAATGNKFKFSSEVSAKAIRLKETARPNGAILDELEVWGTYV